MDRPRGVLFDLDNTAYPYDPCHAAGLAAATNEAANLRPDWNLAVGDFERLYDDARRAVKEQVGPNAAAVHCRLLYCKLLVERRLGRSDLDLTQSLHDAYWAGYFA